MPTFESNEPTIERLRRLLKLAPALADVDDDTLQELLDTSIADVEQKTASYFDGRVEVEKRDGTGGRSLQLWRRPATSVRSVSVELPVLALHRDYGPEEVKLYRSQGYIVLFTFKLAAESASLHLDQQVYGNLLPRDLPQVALITYTAGFPFYDPAARATTFDGGTTWLDGDLRLPTEQNYLKQLQTAALNDAAASILSQTGGLEAGLVAAVSFDGLSETMNPQAYGPQVQALIQARDAILTSRRRLNFGTVGQ